MTQQPHSTQHPSSTPQAGGEEKPPAWGEAGQTAGRSPANSGWVTGGVTFAGVLMLMNGVVSILQGISALAKDDVYTRVGDYVYKINLTGWGVILLCLGAVLVVTGWGVLTGAAWARVTGIVLASLSGILQFVFLPYAPVWSVIVVAIDVFVIWALASYDPAASRSL
jgi:hypothetical protein